MKKLIVLLSLVMSTSVFATEMPAETKPANYSCSGTEPFWDLSIKENTIAFNNIFLDETSKKEEIISRTGAHGVSPEFAFEVKSASLNASIVTDASCSDGMSESTYTHAILLNVNGALVYGCCNQVK